MTLSTNLEISSQEELAKPCTKKTNFTKNEWNALKELRKNRNIIIKQADKVGAVVVMNRGYYGIVLLFYYYY